MIFFFNDTATTEIYTLSLHDALPISYTFLMRRWAISCRSSGLRPGDETAFSTGGSHCWPPSGISSTTSRGVPSRSEEHTSELQSRQYLVCRLLLEKKKKNTCTSDDST